MEHPKLKRSGTDLSDSPTTAAVAVLMSVYKNDDPKLFDRALKSIVQQNYKEGPIRIYLCLDGPLPDATRQIVNAYKQSIHKLIENPKNLGLGASLNKLINSLEEEEFVFRMDSDDFSYENRIECQLSVMREHPEYDILGAAIKEVDAEGHLRRFVYYPSKPSEVRKFMRRRSPVAHPSVCFRRSAIDKFKNYPDHSHVEDIMLWFQCILLGLKIANVDKVLVEMTQTEAFFYRRGFVRAKAELKAWLWGTWKIYGFSPVLLLPFARFILRLLPTPVIEWIYKSPLR